MSAAILKKVMEKEGKTPVDVASATGLAVNTITRYLAGATVHRSTERALQNWISQHSKDLGNTKVA